MICFNNAACARSKKGGGVVCVIVIILMAGMCARQVVWVDGSVIYWPRQPPSTVRREHSCLQRKLLCTRPRDFKGPVSLDSRLRTERSQGPLSSELSSLLAEGAALHQTGHATSWGTKHGRAVLAIDHWVGVREHRGDCKAIQAPHIHKVRVWLLHETLELVCLLFVRLGRPQHIFHHLCLW